MWLRLRQVALVAAVLEPAVEQFREVLGLEVCYRDPGVGSFGLENALLPIGNTLLEIVAPIEEKTAGGRYLERRGGDGGYMVITQCDEHAPRRRRVEELGVRIVTERDSHDYTIMQLHPRDTGGSFFEIDEQKGLRAHEADGPWEPAGGDGWTAAKRLSRVTGVTAVEMQCADPTAIAAKWAEIAQLPVHAGADGASITLDNAVLRFAPITDGRPEGLSEMDVTTADRAGILDAAKRIGAYRTDTQVYLGGMRINLV